MIKLENVSTESLLRFLKFDALNNQKNFKTYLIVSKNKITNYQQLKDLIYSGDSKTDDPFLKECVKDVETKIESLNKNNESYSMIECNNYRDSNLDTHYFRSADCNTNCDVLILEKPTLFISEKQASIKKLKINVAKRLLNQVLIQDNKYKNAFTECFNSFSLLDAHKLRKSINFYEEQVIRQAKETSTISKKIFFVNKEQKQQIVEAELKKYVKYLIKNNSRYIWGNLTEEEKNLLLESTSIKNKSPKYLIIRERLINIITNYTTLEELNSDLIKQKTLDRFIVK